MPLLSAQDETWRHSCIQSGLSSGEGLIWAVRDAIFKTERAKEKGVVCDYQEVKVDAGVTDKRLLVIESEFASTLKVMAREGNTLSATIRQAWDQRLENHQQEQSCTRHKGRISMSATLPLTSLSEAWTQPRQPTVLQIDSYGVASSIHRSVYPMADYLLEQEQHTESERAAIEADRLNAGLQAERLRHKSELTALTGSLCIPDGSGRHSQYTSKRVMVE